MHRKENVPCNGKQTMHIPPSKMGIMGEEGDLAWDQSQPEPGFHDAVPAPKGGSQGRPRAHGTSFSGEQQQGCPCWEASLGLIHSDLPAV